MANFYSVFGFLAVNGLEFSGDPGAFDMLSSLPLEMATTILRYIYLLI